MEQRRSIMKGLLRGVRKLYKQRIVHRDIKLDNIWIDEDLEENGLTIKVADFGFACLV